MDTRRTLIVDAFTDQPLSGNAAGVVPDAEGLTDAQMLAVARELNASETAFLLPSDEADRRVRYFTPTTEVDLCGHATVASHAVLAEEGLDDGTHTLETNVGVLDIDIDGDTVWMTQSEAQVVERELAYADVADALGVEPDCLVDVGEDLPLATATTGLNYLVVPVNFLSNLGAMDPDRPAVAALCEAVGAVGLYAFTFDAVERGSTLQGRMFAPLLGVDEDPVTGTASGAVAAYLRRFGAFDDVPEEMVFEQGHFVDRPGRVRVRAAEGRIRVGGRAVRSLDGELRVPDIAEDEILEA